MITLANLLCGCIALIFATKGDFYGAFFFVSLGIFLDFFDGFFARLFKVSSPLGLQLDSLADMVTSGVVPGYVMFLMLSGAEDAETLPSFLPYLGFIVTLGSCFRLANFNIDTRQTDSFIGLPTPANALFILSLPLIKDAGSMIAFEILINPWVLLLIACCSAYILNAEIPLFSLKVKNFNFRSNALQFSFLGIALILLILLRFSGVPVVILAYILLSVVKNRRLKSLG